MLLGVSPFPFNDPAWGWEVKFDGFRILAFREGKQARLLTRNGNELGIALLGLDAILSFRFSNSLPLQARVV